MDYDLFISYARRDNSEQRITDLVGQIKKDYEEFAGGVKLEVFFDTNEILGGDDWRHRILDGLRQAHLLLVCLSPAYLESEYCEWEFTEYLNHELARAFLGEGVMPIYFVQVPGWEEKGFEQRAAAWVAELRRRQHFDLRSCFNEGAEALKEAAIKATMNELNGQIRDRLGRLQKAIEAKGNVDRHNRHFVGRFIEMRRLREMVGRGTVGVLTAVHGLGGIGKTALAVEYAHAFAHEYPGGRWQVPCEGRDDLRVALVSLACARDLEFEFTDEQKMHLDLGFERVLRELKKRADAAHPHRVLLILDNVDQPRLLDPMQVRKLPRADWLHVVATTRLGEPELFHRHKDRSFLAIDELPEADAVALIEGYQPGRSFSDAGERAAAGEIVRLLGCFTLAVEVAAVYLGQFADDVTCASFLARLKKEGLTGIEGISLEPSVRVLHDEKSLSLTIEPTLERFSGPEMLVLRYAALLPADHVPLSWLRVLAGEKFPELLKDAEPGYPDAWQNIVRKLAGLRLFQLTGVRSDDGKPLTVRIHRLMQQIVIRRSGFSEADLNSLITPHAENRCRFLETGWLDWKNRWEIEPLRALSKQLLDRKDERASSLANNVAKLLHQFVRFVDSEPLIRDALAIDEANCGHDHPRVAISLGNLARLLQATNRLSEVEPLMRRALAINEARYGPEHSLVARDLSNLAQYLLAANRLSEGESLMRRTLEIDEACLGTEDPLVARDLNNLAQFLLATNRLSEAERLIRKALAIDEAFYGPEHPTVSTDINSLFGLLVAKNQLSEAEALMRRALAIDEAIYGSKHPEVATDLNNLGNLLTLANRLSEAEPLIRRAINMHEAVFGPGHYDVAITLHNLAELLVRSNRLSEAEPEIRRALAIDESSYGPKHPRVARDLRLLGELLRMTNRFSESEVMMRRALVIDESSYGPEHRIIARDLYSLAELLRATNRLSEALPLLCRALAIYEAIHGSEHPSVADCLHGLAVLLKDTNRFSEAEPLMRRTLAIYEASYGPEDPRITACLSDLASLLKNTNRFPESEFLLRRALAICEASCESEHSIIAKRMNNLALLLMTTNRIPEAETLLRRAVAICEASYESEHPRIAIQLNNLALLLLATNRPSEAEPLIWRALSINEAYYGEVHPDVARDLWNLAVLLQATSRHSEAEPLMRRAVEILLSFCTVTGHRYPLLESAINNYAMMLRQMGQSSTDVLARLNAVGRPFGIQFGG